MNGPRDYCAVRSGRRGLAHEVDAKDDPCFVAILLEDMNALENWFCSSRIWRRITQRRILPWLLDGVALGDHVLEIGAGAGAATAELHRRAGRVTSLEYSASLATKLAQHNGSASRIVRADAARLPFASGQFSSVIAVLMLHHLPSEQAQDRTFREAARVLHPGGIFVAFEIHDRWLQRVSHFRSTFTPLRTGTLAVRLAAAGFGAPRIDSQPQGFRLLARNSGRDVDSGRAATQTPG